MALGLTESPETYTRRTVRLKATCAHYLEEARGALGHDDLDAYLEATGKAAKYGLELVAHLTRPTNAKRSA